MAGRHNLVNLTEVQCLYARTAASIALRYEPIPARSSRVLQLKVLLANTWPFKEIQRWVMVSHETQLQ
jgi:hypothetical protein